MKIDKIKILIPYFRIICYFSFLIICLVFLNIFCAYTEYKGSNINQFFNIVSVELTSDNEEYPSLENYQKLAEHKDVLFSEVNRTDILLSSSLKNFESDDLSDLGLFNLKGVDKDNFFDLKFNNIDIQDGRSFSTSEIKNGDNVVILNYYVAKMNNLSVGDNFKVTIVNPNNNAQTYEEDFLLVGIFKTNENNLGYKLSQNQLLELISEEFEEHNHEEEEHEEGVEHSNAELSEQERVASLKENILINDLTNIYIPNETISNLNQKNVTNFGEDLQLEDYQGSYILKTSNSKNFKEYGLSILPKGFEILDNTDALKSWLPITYLFKFTGLIVLICVIPLILTYRSFARLYLHKRDEQDNQFFVWGYSLSDVVHYYSKNYLLPLFLSNIILVILIPSVVYITLSKLLISDNFSNYYLNIQIICRNLVSTNHSVLDYVLWNQSYFLLATLFIILTSLLYYLIFKRELENFYENKGGSV